MFSYHHFSLCLMLLACALCSYPWAVSVWLTTGGCSVSACFPTRSCCVRWRRTLRAWTWSWQQPCAESWQRWLRRSADFDRLYRTWWDTASSMFSSSCITVIQQCSSLMSSKFYYMKDFVSKTYLNNVLDWSVCLPLSKTDSSSVMSDL